jgi:hypothetical protein
MSTMYAEVVDNIVTQYPLTIFQIRTMYPSVSWPDEPSAEALATYNLVVVWPTRSPKICKKHKLAEAMPEYDHTQVRWEQTWIVY